MKKLTKSTLSLMLVLCMLLLSFTACGPTDAEREQGLVDKEIFSFDAKSLEEMKEMFSNDEIQPKHDNDIFEKAIDSEKLSFDKYIIVQIKYMPIQNGYEEFTGDVTLSILWNKREPDENFYEIGWDFCYYKDGLQKANVTKGFSQIDESKLYTKQHDQSKYFNYTEYVYLINDNYCCKYLISNEAEEKEEISNQLLELCRDIEAKLQGQLGIKDT